jgi:hypothetical protein
MDEGPSRPVVNQSGAATGTPSGDNIEFETAVIQSGRGGVGI